MAPTPEPKPDAFLSYTRFDDRRGRISDFRTWLSDAVEEVSGKPFEIFQDVDDEGGILLGKTWQKELDRMLDEVRFFIPVLTPKFFASKACRDELSKFLALEEAAGRDDLILPIYWIRCAVLEEPALLARDELAAAIAARQRWDWRHLRHDNFESAKVLREFEALALQIDRVRRGLFRVVADNEQVAASGGSRAQVQVVEPQAAPETRGSDPLLLPPGTVFRDVEEPWCPEMVVIPPGVFNMGSPVVEVERMDNEGPRHRVKIEKPFALGRYPVTRGEFAAFVEETGHIGMGADIWTGYHWKTIEHASWRSPGFAQNDRHPVVCVSHEDASAYIEWLSEKADRRYALPSEAMWEYACRAGTDAPFWNGNMINTDQANYDGNQPYGGGKKGLWREATTQVDFFDANPFGLHDMHGNILEWCADRWHGNYKGAPVDGTAWLAGNEIRHVLRGGSWYVNARLLRSACRSHNAPVYRYSCFGFRCARVQE